MIVYGNNIPLIALLSLIVFGFYIPPTLRLQFYTQVKRRSDSIVSYRIGHTENLSSIKSHLILRNVNKWMRTAFDTVSIQ